VTTLGGNVVTIGTNNREIIEFPNALLFMNAMAPSGPTKGSTVNHIGFSVPNLRPVIDKVKAERLPHDYRREAPAGDQVENDIGLATGGDVSGIAVCTRSRRRQGGARRDQEADRADRQPSHHFFGAQQKEMHAWYMKVFGAKDRPGLTGTFIGADLPGPRPELLVATEPVVGTRGRALDHIGFEVRTWKRSRRALTAQGIKLDRPYTKVDALGIAIAFITDPWGTYIELTEGLDKVK
jgi:hypothetical protein